MSLIEVFADVCCPFAHVGLRRLIERRDELGRGDIVVRVRAWPLEWVNGEPLSADAVAEEVAELRAQVAPDLFSGFDPGRFPATSLPGFALAAEAYRRDDKTGERVSLALRRALFDDGRDVANPLELQGIAGAYGLDLPAPGAEQDAARDWEEGRRRGVQGSPHFFVEDEGFFCPTLEVERVDGRLRILADPEGFEAFVDRCLHQE